MRPFYCDLTTLEIIVQNIHISNTLQFINYPICEPMSLLHKTVHSSFARKDMIVFMNIHIQALFFNKTIKSA